MYAMPTRWVSMDEGRGLETRANLLTEKPVYFGSQHCLGRPRIPLIFEQFCHVVRQRGPSSFGMEIVGFQKEELSAIRVLIELFHVSFENRGQV